MFPRTMPQRWLVVAVLPIVGLALLWWADQQLIDIRTTQGATFQRSAWWIILGWLLTMIAAGVMFGVAASLTRTVAGKATLGATLLAGILPLATVVYYFMFFVGGWWSPLRLSSFTAFLVSHAAIAVSCVVIGFLAAGLLPRRSADEPTDPSVERIRSL